MKKKSERSNLARLFLLLLPSLNPDQPLKTPQQRLERIAEAARPALAAAFKDQPDSLAYPPRVLDVGAGTGCLVPSLLRVAGSERGKLKLSSSDAASSSSSALLPMDYLAVDVSAGMLQALERIHSGSGGEKREEAENGDKKNNLLLGNLPRIRTWLGDVESIPQFQAPFDVCLFNAVFGNVFDQRSSLLSAALLMRPGTGRVVVAHPMGRRWHERLRAADAEIVPHALPGDAEKWAELLRGLPLELVGVAEEGEEALVEGGEEGAKAAAAAAQGDDGGGGNGNESSNGSSSSSTSATTTSSRRLLVDDEDCYIAVLRVPPAWRLPASLYGSLPLPAAAASSSASAASALSSSPPSSPSSPSGGDNNSDNSEGKSRLPLIPQLLSRSLPWQQQQDDGEKAGGEERQDKSSPLPPLLLGGEVVKGFGRGSSKMGIPTANLDPVPLEEALAGVPDGVYFGWARLLPENEKAREEAEEEGSERESREDLDHQPHKCVLNIGRRPTFDGEKKGVGVLSVEVHVLHRFEKGGRAEEEVEEEELLNFCGRELRVVATGFVRPEMRFPGIAALVSRIRSDVATAAVALEEREHAWAKGHGFLWGRDEEGK